MGKLVAIAHAAQNESRTFHIHVMYAEYMSVGHLV